ncbi:putative dolichyl pyrophosphate Man9GlcNAc2 alpha-1,3-glucosyltransferase [Trichoplax sp. H2]|nr:putative dolichyl pyrophosphate Man9GlcNAc2 alpha-1,3-glucosyltransferase [Trichoplax sp. H2]|eukprot:RDD37931.1 putative dolichyl pyrophosphate Man9GlcNAc2 alpha-1,3-glucosyltransferase [Trichoplax sp. H2]
MTTLYCNRTITERPASLLLPWYPAESGLFLLYATFSMVPLLIKDGLLLPYISIMMLYLYLLYITFRSYYQVGTIQKYMYGISIMVMSCLHGYAAIAIPPRRYPDLVAVLISAISCCFFTLFFLYCNYLQFIASDDLIKASVTSKSKSD